MKGLELPKVKTPIPGKNSINLAQRLQDVECPNITYLSHDYPVFLEKSYLLNVWDVDGNRFVDLTSFFGVSLPGHNHPLIKKVLKNPKIINGMGDVLPSRSKVELLEKLSHWLGGGYQGILSQNGSDAVESALKTAFLYTKKKGVIAFEGGYHGLSFGGLFVTFNPKFKEPFKDVIAPITRYFPYPYEENWHQVLDEIRSFITTEKDVGLVLIEPVQARGGVRIAPKEFMTELYRITREFGVLLAFDEIFTGFGRCGKPFAFEYYGIKPDIITLGKAFSSAFPISVMMAKREVMSAWPSSDGEAVHTYTFLGHPLLCQVALEVLNYMEKEKVWVQSEEKGRKFLEKLRPLQTEFPKLIKGVRGLGLLIGVEFFEPVAFEVSKVLLRFGYITLPSGLRGEVLELAPPVLITEGIMDDFVSALKKVLKDGFKG